MVFLQYRIYAIITSMRGTFVAARKSDVKMYIATLQCPICLKTDGRIGNHVRIMNGTAAVSADGQPMGLTRPVIGITEKADCPAKVLK